MLYINQVREMSTYALIENECICTCENKQALVLTLISFDVPLACLF